MPLGVKLSGERAWERGDAVRGVEGRAGRGDVWGAVMDVADEGRQ